MKKKTVTRKQLLKEPDQFITFSGKMIQFGRSHLKSILIGSGIVVALFLAVIVVGQIANRNELKASEKVEKAIAKYSAALMKTNPEEAYQLVKNDFEEIFHKYDTKVSAKTARIVYGDISFAAKDADTAIAMYKGALDDYLHSPALKNIILNGLGYAYLLKKENQEAIQAFDKIVSGEESTLKKGALFNLAWLYGDTGDKEKSSAMYKQLLDDFPDSMYNDLVKEKINI